MKVYTKNQIRDTTTLALYLALCSVRNTTEGNGQEHIDDTLRNLEKMLGEEINDK